MALVVLAAVGYYLATARGGRELYAIGSDPDAADLYGLQVRRRVLTAFVLCGALAGLAGVVYTARYGTVSSGRRLGIELQAVGAAVIGGVAIFGGSGTVWGAAIGAMLLVTINALPILGIPDYWQRAVVGGLIISAVVLDRVLSERQARKLIEARTSHDHHHLGRPEGNDTRTYAAYSRPLWRLLFTREAAIIALLVAVFAYANANVLNFDGPLTIYYLLLDIAPILLIALPMTLVIITGEIDLSVASVVGLGSVLVGIHRDFGLSIPVAAVLAIVVGAVCGPSTASSSRTSGCRRWRSRSARSRSTAGSRSGCSAPPPSPTSRRSGPTSPSSASAKSRLPVIVIPFLVLLVLFVAAAALLAVRAGRLRDRAERRPRASPASTWSAPSSCSSCSPARCRAGRHLLHAPLRQRPRRNATGLELQVIAAVLLGGVSIFGGRGALHGVVAGVILLGVLSSAMRLEGYTVNVINIIIGLLLIASVISTSVLAWLSAEARQSRRVFGPGKRRQAASR